MLSISPAVGQVLRAQSEAQQQKIDVALLKKSLDAQKQAGDATVELLRQAAELQTQLANGRIDVKA